MTIVLDKFSVLSAVVASSSVAMFVGLSIWLSVYSLRNLRTQTRRIAVPNAIVGVVSAILCMMFGVWWWHDWSPWAVTISDNAVELKYLLSTQRIELTEVEHVDFELVHLRRGRERSIVRLTADGRVYQVTQDPEPTGELPTRPVRQVFDQLAARLPPTKCRDVSE
jgi:hypothetical protein